LIDPIAIRDCFGISGLNIHWYGIIICIGIVLGVLVGIKLANKKNYKSDMILDFILLALPLAIVCARIYYVVFEWQMYAANPWKVFAIWEGGIAIYGGVIGAVIAALIFCKWKKVSFGDLLDIGAPGLILGQAIGRWGNFANQEAYGPAITDPSMQWFPFGVYIQAVNEWHMATFFYESMWNLIVFAILLSYFKKAKHKGNVFVMYLIAYGIGRFFIEGLRMDSLWLVPGLIRVSQLLSAILVIFGIIYLAVMHKKEPKLYCYEGKYLLNPKEEAQDSEENPEQPGAGQAEDRKEDDAAKVQDAEPKAEYGPEEQGDEQTTDGDSVKPE